MFDDKTLVRIYKNGHKKQTITKENIYIKITDAQVYTILRVYLGVSSVLRAPNTESIVVLAAKILPSTASMSNTEGPNTATDGK